MTPNQPNTPLHSFRYPPDEWEAVKAAAAAAGETVTDVIARALREYVDQARSAGSP